MSTTVTIALQELTRPPWSVMVNATKLSPISLQEKVVISILELMLPQLSELPKSISVEEILAKPF